MNPERKYIAISIKHTAHGWRWGKPCVLWGHHQTEDNEPRCFASYTLYLSKAERYAAGDFRKHGYLEDIVPPEPVKFTIDLMKRWKNYDTVLVDEKEYRSYCEMCYIATEAPT